MEVGQGPNWGCSAKEKKIDQATNANQHYPAITNANQQLTKQQ
jgi:hypothetical protein